jgi:tetratricopeptide (TPR) repeat protein
MNLTGVFYDRGDSERATELFEESMDLFRVLGDKYLLAECLINMELVVYSQGDLGRAAKLTEEAVVQFRELGNRGGVSMGLYNLGWMTLLQDDLGRAADSFEKSLALAWDTGTNRIVLSALEGFACVAGAQEVGAVRAAQLWGAAQVLHETQGIPRDIDWLAEAGARISVVRSDLGEGAWGEAWREGRAGVISPIKTGSIAPAGSPTRLRVIR